jgi:hypothetical protein
MRIKIVGKITMERILAALHDIYRRLPENVAFKTANIYINFEDEKGKNWFFTHEGQIVDLVLFEPDIVEGIPNPPPETRRKSKTTAKLSEIDQKPEEPASPATQPKTLH